MEEIVHCLTYLVKAMHSTRFVKDLRYDKEEGKVTIVYKNGHEKDVDVNWMTNDRAIVKKIIKEI